MSFRIMNGKIQFFLLSYFQQILLLPATNEPEQENRISLYLHVLLLISSR